MTMTNPLQAHSVKRILVLVGGWSAEREVSHMTGREITKHLKALYPEVRSYDVTPDIHALMDVISTFQPDVIFNALHGTGGEDGTIQGFLDVLGIPYTHSGVRASAVAMDKVLSQHILASIGLPIIPSLVRHRHTLTHDGDHPMIAPDIAAHFQKAPLVIKPVSDGSSRGVHMIQDGRIPDDVLSESWTYGDPVLVQKYIQGREISVAVLGEAGTPLDDVIARQLKLDRPHHGQDVVALGALELRPDPAKASFYDYTAKYTDGVTTHIMPADVPAADYAKALSMAEQAHAVMGCRGISRTDFLYDGRDFYVLELNTQPGMTPLSIAPEIAAYAGVSFDDLLQYLIRTARCEARAHPGSASEDGLMRGDALVRSMGA